MCPTGRFDGHRIQKEACQGARETSLDQIHQMHVLCKSILACIHYLLRQAVTGVSSSRKQIHSRRATWCRLRIGSGDNIEPCNWTKIIMSTLFFYVTTPKKRIVLSDVPVHFTIMTHFHRNIELSRESSITTKFCCNMEKRSKQKMKWEKEY